MNTRHMLRAITAISALAVVQGVLAQQPARPYNQTFLTNYSLLQPRAKGQGGDLAYVAPGTMQRLATYKAVAVDQPEIHFSPDSEIKGMKPDDQTALAEAMRQALSERLAAGGYPVTDKPGPGVLVMRVALTDLMIRKKKRGLLAYTPVGAVVKAAADTVREMLDKVDFIEMTFQAELIDGASNDVLGAIVAPRGARKAEGQKEQRIDLDELNDNSRAWGNRLRCQLDNAKLPEAQWANCTDDAANQARYGSK